MKGNGQMFDRRKVFLGIAPTSWWNDDFPSIDIGIPFEQCVSEMALAGFEGCSMGRKYPASVDVLQRALALRHLRISEPWASTYFTLREMELQTIDGFTRQIELIKALGGTDIVVAELGGAVHQQPVALMPNRPIFDDAQWRALARGLDYLGHIAESSGMHLCYHPHMGTGVQTRADVDRLAASTDPRVVHLLLDTGHATFAGDDPLAFATAYADRIKHVHLKDVRRSVLKEALKGHLSFQSAIEAGVFTVPGDGDIDFRPILEALAERGYEGWLVVEAEQDPAKAPPLEHAIKAREYLRRVAGL